MAKKKDAGEQAELFKLLGEYAGEIKESAIRYKKFQKTRIGALKREIAEKTIIRDLANKAGLQRMPDGKIKFKVDGVEIEIEPRDDVVRVKEPKAKKTATDGK